MSRLARPGRKKTHTNTTSSPKPPESFQIDLSSGLLPTAGPLYLSTIFSGTATLSARRVRRRPRFRMPRRPVFGGNATRQNVGCGVVNSRPISALPERTGPRNATWHSCSSCVFLCCRRTLRTADQPRGQQHQRPVRIDRQCFRLFFDLVPCASVPRIRTATCINTRWLRRRAPVFGVVFVG